MSDVKRVAIVGRMNVGKSTLFNCLSTNIKSLTLNLEGVTRDYIKDVVSWQGVDFELVDTGGISFKKLDKEIGKFLRKHNKNVVLVINKTDSKRTEENISEFHKLGFEKTIFVSAQHARGIGDLLELIVIELNKIPKKYIKEEEPQFKVVLLGKPNVGKSSLLNLLLKKERSIVADIPGTTREAIQETIKFYKENI